jgi:hypothetical protein
VDPALSLYAAFRIIHAFCRLRGAALPCATGSALAHMLDPLWYTYDPEAFCLTQHADRSSALQFADAVIRANPKKLMQILVLDGIVSMPSTWMTAIPRGQENRGSGVTAKAVQHRLAG